MPLIPRYDAFEEERERQSQGEGEGEGEGEGGEEGKVSTVSCLVIALHTPALAFSLQQGLYQARQGHHVERGYEQCQDLGDEVWSG